MKATEILDKLIRYSPVPVSPTVDTVKYGDPEREVSKLAFCFTATPKVLAEAKKWGADAIVTHEPTFYDHYDNFVQNRLTGKKMDAVRDCGAVIMRYHDHMHACHPDLIHQAFIDNVGLDCVYDGERMLLLFDRMTVGKLAQKIKNALDLKYIPVIGNPNLDVRSVALCLGACGDACQQAALEKSAEVVIAGEISEWRTGEQFRDMSQLGIDSALILIGHCNSEKMGMNALCNRFAKENTGIECRYIDCGNIYSYV